MLGFVCLEYLTLGHMSSSCPKYSIYMTNVTGSAKTGHNRIVSNSCLLNIYNLCIQVYPLANFQLHMPITLGVTALQSHNNRKIDLYSKHRENKLQVLTKTVVTYQWIEVRS